jgi:hypothetical protein
MRSECRSFQEFWTAFAREQRPFRLGRASLSLARLVLQQRGRERWRWAAAAAVLTAGKLLAGTFDEDPDGREAESPSDALSLPTGEHAPGSRAERTRAGETAWAAWM